MDLRIIAISFICVLIFSIISFVFGIFTRKKIAEAKIVDAETESKRIVEKAKNDAEKICQRAEIRSREEQIKRKEEIDKEIKERRSELLEKERRNFQKEEQLDRKENKIEQEYQNLEEYKEKLNIREEKISNFENERIKELERIANLTREEAKNEIIEELDRKLVDEKAQKIKIYEEELKRDTKKLAQNVIVNAIQKCAADHTSEETITVVGIPSEEMKGRIIGKEGRNIRSLELLTGVQFIIDDTPEVITVSGFDPVRREVARLTLEKLIADGRIQPAKIEEMFDKAVDEIGQIIEEEGMRAQMEAGVSKLAPEIVTLLGKLKYRTSYGQNVLKHSIEVANIAKLIAIEVGADPNIAARGGLLHDLGKALDHDPNIVGTHVELGVEVLKRNKEKDVIVNIVEAHHGDVEPTSIEAVIVMAADAISASRPGARRDTFEAYIKRLQSLEDIATSFDGVEKAFAISAGREIRIILKPEKISDNEMTLLAHEVTERIENEVAFPGTIKVSLIREKRVVDQARQSKKNR